MVGLENVLGAGLLIDSKYDIVDANGRCKAIFREPLDEIKGTTLQTLSQRGFFSEQTLYRWEQGVAAVIAGDGDKRTEPVTLEPGAHEEEFDYELTIEPVDDDRDLACCVLRSVGARRRYEKTITRLHAATRELLTVDDVESVLCQTAAAANDVIGFPGTAVWKYDADRDTFRPLSFEEQADSETNTLSSSVNSPHDEAITSNETIIEDSGGGKPNEEFTQEMYVPIGEAGVLRLGTVGRPFDETDVQFAEILAENAAAAIRVTETTASLRQEQEHLELLRQVLTRVLRHNIRNDMNVISANAELLSTHVPDPKQKFLDDIQSKVEDVSLLSEKAGVFERILDKSERTFNLNTTINFATDRVLRKYPDATIQQEIEEECRVVAQGALDVAIRYLLENACEHSDDAPSVTVTIATTQQTATITVEDDGPGIPDNEIEVLKDGSETTLNHGSGLGLWIVNWVVEQSDGTIDFETEDGTCVEITLSRKKRDYS